MYYENFQRLCEINKVTPSKVSKATGISTATLTSWKKGAYTPKQDKLQLIADYFKVSVDYLMTGKEPTLTIGNVEIDAELLLMSKKLKEYALKIRNLSEDKQEAVFNVIDLLLVEKEKTEVEEWKKL